MSSRLPEAVSKRGQGSSFPQFGSSPVITQMVKGMPFRHADAKTIVLSLCFFDILSAFLIAGQLAVLTLKTGKSDLYRQVPVLPSN